MGTDAPKPFWQTLKWILSVSMVLTFFLEKISFGALSLSELGSVFPLVSFQDLGGFNGGIQAAKWHGISLHNDGGSLLSLRAESSLVVILQGVLLALNMLLIPMFIFIAAYLTQKSTWTMINQSVLPAVITYSAFQGINTIPAFLAGNFSWNALLLFPLDGVWFILAVPFWRWGSLGIAYLKPSRFLKCLLFCLFLGIGFTAFYFALPYTGFALVVGYFSIFYLGQQISSALILRLRAIALFPFASFCCGVLLLFIAAMLFLPMNLSLMTISTLSPAVAILNYLLFMLFSILWGVIAIYAVRYLKVLAKVAPKALGIYLIHPIICTSILAILHRYSLELNLSGAVGLTIITVMISLLLASFMPFRWLLAPKFS